MDFFKKNKLIRHLRDLLIVVIIGFVITASFSSGEYFWNNATHYVLYSLLIGGTLWKGNEFIGYIISKYSPWNHKPGFTFRLAWFTMIIYSALCVIVVNAFWNLFDKNSNWDTFFSDYKLTMLVEYLVALAITSIFFTLTYFRYWKIALIEKSEIEKQVIAARYQALRNQLNPHFLFNCFSTLDSLIHIDPKKASDFTQHLSRVYRYVLDQKELIPLNKEMEFVDTYLYLEKMRFGNKLLIENNTSNTEQFIVPPMSVQLLIENAIKHNIISLENPLHISISIDKDSLIVSNKCNIKKQSPRGTGTGLSNLNERIKHLTGKDVVIEQTNAYFLVRLPLLQKNAKL